MEDSIQSNNPNSPSEPPNPGSTPISMPPSAPIPTSPVSPPPPPSQVVTITSGPQGNNFFSNLRSKLPKILIVIVLIGVIGEGIYLFAPVLLSKKITENNAVTASNGLGQLILSSNKSQFTKGEPIPIKVILDTGSYSAQGVDVLIKYDPNQLDANDAKVSPGTIFTDYPNTTINKSLGQIQISGTNGISKKHFKGIGDFASFTLKAKAAGTTQVSLQFKPDSTSDSNILDSDSSHDVLSKVQNLNLEIK